MTRINKNNYEVFFVDYLDGALDPETLVEVENFLKENPDLKEELNGLNSVLIPEESKSCPDKKSLYKSVYDEKASFQDACVAFIEDDLSPAEKDNFEHFLHQHPELDKEVALYSRTKLKPDQSVVFGDKDRLYQHPVRMITWYRIAAVAATLTAIVVIASLAGSFNHTESFAGLKTNTTSQKQSTEKSSINNNRTAEDYQAKTESFQPSPAQPANQSTATGARPLNQSQNMLPGSQTSVALASSHLFQNGANKPNGSSLALSGREEHQSVLSNPLKSDQQIALMSSHDLTSNAFKAQRPSTNMIPIYEDQNEITAGESAIMAQNDALSFQSQPNSNNHPSVFRLGMNLLSGLTGKALHYKTDDEGRVTHIAFDSKFVAFNIPVNGVK